MIGKIIDALNVVGPAVGQKYGLCEKREDTIYEYVGGGSGKPINVDQDGSWSYWRMSGKVRKTRASAEETKFGCDGWRHSIGLRFVLVTHRDSDVCETSSRIIRAVNDFPTAKRAIGTATGALNVLFPSALIEVDSTDGWKAEVGSARSIPLEIVFQYADITIDLLTERECLIYC